MIMRHIEDHKYSAEEIVYLLRSSTGSIAWSAWEERPRAIAFQRSNATSGIKLPRKTDALMRVRSLPR